MPDKVLSPVWTTPVLVSEHLVLWAEHFAAQRAGSRGRDVHVDYVGSELAKGLVADVADPTVAGMRPLNGTWPEACSASTRISSMIADPTNQTTNPGDLSRVTHCQAANNNTTWNDTYTFL